MLGGARSGKSSYAERLAAELGAGEVLYVATAEARDEEMRSRIQAHRAKRPSTWRTLEAPTNVAATLGPGLAGVRVVLFDCVTLWVTNVMLALGEDPEPTAAEEAIRREVDALLELIARTASTFLVVSNEVGLGLVPPYPLGRLYRDALGRVNQTLAARADHVVFMVAGMPIDLRALPLALGGRGMTDSAGEA